MASGPRSSTTIPVQSMPGVFETTRSPTFSQPGGDVFVRAMIFKVSPGTGKAECLTVVCRDLIERCRQDIKRAAPSTACAKADRHGVQGASRELDVDVVVCDRVAPGNQRPKLLSALIVSTALPIDLGPDIEPETREVVLDRVGLRVVSIQRPAPCQALPQQPAVSRVMSPIGDCVHGLGV